MIKTQCDVIGLGQCSLDILGKIEQYPSLDQKVELSSLVMQGGGPVATALVTLARLGVETGFIGAVGDDEHGKQIRQGLIDEGVNCVDLHQADGESSQLAFIAIDENGHRNIFWHRGSAEPIIPENLDEILAAGVKVVHLDGLHLKPALALAKAARSAGIETVLDAGTFRRGIERLLPMIDHIVVSENFAHQITGRDDPLVALDFLSGYAGKAVVVTCGHAGGFFKNVNEEDGRYPAFDVDAVDTTGCGDVFHGGYIYGVLQNWPIGKRVRFAAACAALKTRSIGGRTAIPDIQEVEKFLSDNGKPDFIDVSS